MRIYLLLFLFIGSLVQADVLDDMMRASNWYHKERYPKNCKPSFIQNMKVTDRKSQNQITVSSNQVGFSTVAFIELNYSKDKEHLPIYGQGAVLDIFVKKLKTVDGYDYWIECPPKRGPTSDGSPAVAPIALR